MYTVLWCEFIPISREIKGYYYILSFSEFHLAYVLHTPTHTGERQRILNALTSLTLEVLNKQITQVHLHREINLKITANIRFYPYLYLPPNELWLTMSSAQQDKRALVPSIFFTSIAKDTSECFRNISYFKKNRDSIFKILIDRVFWTSVYDFFKIQGIGKRVVNF